MKSETQNVNKLSTLLESEQELTFEEVESLLAELPPLDNERLLIPGYQERILTSVLAKIAEEKQSP